MSTTEHLTPYERATLRHIETRDGLEPTPDNEVDRLRRLLAESRAREQVKDAALTVAASLLAESDVLLARYNAAIAAQNRQAVA
jgi:hypothetical protein